MTICDERNKNEIYVIALINDVYDETTGCTKLSLRGLQQMAVLDKTAKDINDNEANREGMHLCKYYKRKLY